MPGEKLTWLVFHLFKWPLSALDWFMSKVLHRKGWG